MDTGFNTFTLPYTEESHGGTLKELLNASAIPAENITFNGQMVQVRIPKNEALIRCDSQFCSLPLTEFTFPDIKGRRATKERLPECVLSQLREDRVLVPYGSDKHIRTQADLRNNEFTKCKDRFENLKLDEDGFKELADYGFYPTGVADEIVHVTYDGKLEGWEKGDTVFGEFKRHHSNAWQTIKCMEEIPTTNTMDYPVLGDSPTPMDLRFDAFMAHKDKFTALNLDDNGFKKLPRQ